MKYPTQQTSITQDGEAFPTIRAYKGKGVKDKPEYIELTQAGIGGFALLAKPDRIVLTQMQAQELIAWLQKQLKKVS